MEDKTAVILFVYNRPVHTQKVVNGLQRNKIDKLYVFADGPKSTRDEDMLKISQTRRIIEQIDWCAVEVGFSSENKGLAESVIQGVSEVFAKGYNRVIVLEDDCVPNDNFIAFMESALNYYDECDDVMHVSGFGLPLKKCTDADVYFTPYPCSWGWATWAKYWCECDFYQSQEYNSLLQNDAALKRFKYPGEGLRNFMEFQLAGKVNSWLIRWYFYIFSKQGRCVWCYESMIKNDGFDGTGVHKVHVDRFNQRNLEGKASKGVKFENNLEYVPGIILQFRRFFNGKNLWDKMKSIVYLSTGIIVESHETLLK